MTTPDGIFLRWYSVTLGVDVVYCDSGGDGPVVLLIHGLLQQGLISFFGDGHE